MPIQGLTTGLEAKMPTLGQLRKGAAKPKNSKRPGEDLTYFRFVCHDERIEARFHEVYGDEPRIINVHLPFDTLDQNFPTWNEEHGKGGIKHRCDTETMILWQDEEGMYHTDPKPCPYAEYPKGDPRRKCMQKGLLRVIIDELGEWAYVDAVTGGKWDCIGLTQNVLEVEAMARRASLITGKPIGIQGIPCQLKREPRMTSCPPRDGSHGQRVRDEKWMLYLYVHPDFNRALREYMNRHALPAIDLPQLDVPPPDLEVDYYVGNGDDVEFPETEVLDDEPETNGTGERLKADFYKRVQNKIPFYGSIEAIAAALKAEGFTGYHVDNEDKMFEALEAHANEKANAEAA